MRILRGSLVDKILKFNTWAMRSTFPFTGMTLTSKTILLQRNLPPEVAESAVAHELVHTDQASKNGVILWRIKYFYQIIANGYRANPYEVEAYSKMGTPEYLNRARALLAS